MTLREKAENVAALLPGVTYRLDPSLGPSMSMEHGEESSPEGSFMWLFAASDDESYTLAEQLFFVGRLAEALPEGWEFGCIRRHPDEWYVGLDHETPEPPGVGMQGATGATPTEAMLDAVIAALGETE